MSFRRASDLFEFDVALRGPEFREWCSVILDLWLLDSRLHDDFVDVVSFFDFAFESAEKLIRSAYAE